MTRSGGCSACWIRTSCVAASWAGCRRWSGRRRRTGSRAAWDGRSWRWTARRCVGRMIGAPGKGALHLVSAWATASGLVVGQVATEAKSNEITAIPALLRLLALEGRDRHHRRDGLPDGHRPADRRAGGRLRPGPQGQPRAPARPGRVCAFARRGRRPAGTTLPLADVVPHTTIEKGHGRIEQRRCRAIDDPAYLAYIDPDHAWPDLTQRRLHRVDPPHRRRGLDRGPPLPLQPPGRRQAASTGSSAATGASRTASTGSSTSPSTRTAAASAPVTPPRTSPSSATSPSISCAATPPDASASRTPASRQPSATPISAPSSSAPAPD